MERKFIDASLDNCFLILFLLKFLCKSSKINLTLEGKDMPLKTSTNKKKALVVCCYLFFSSINSVFAQEDELLSEADKALKSLIEDARKNIEENECFYDEATQKILEEKGYMSGRVFISFTPYGIPETISGTCLRIPSINSISLTPSDYTDAGIAFISKYYAAFMIDPQKTAFVTKGSTINDKQHSVSYQQLHEGLEVERAGYSIVLNEALEVIFFRGSIVPNISVPSKPYLSLEDALEIVNQNAGIIDKIYFSDLKYVQNYSFESAVPEAHLVYQIEFTTVNQEGVSLVNIDALNGEVVSLYKKNSSVVSFDRNIKDGTLEETSSCNGATPVRKSGRLIFSDSGQCCSQNGESCGNCGSNPQCLGSCYPGCAYTSSCPDEYNAENNIPIIYNFWLNNYGRVSWDNLNAPMMVTIKDETGSCGLWDALTSDDNSNPDCRRVWMNNPSNAALDVMAHEFTHAIALSAPDTLIWQSIIDGDYEGINEGDVPDDQDQYYYRIRKTWHISEHVSDCQGKIIDNSNWAIGDQSQITACCNCTNYTGCCTLRKLDNPPLSCKKNFGSNACVNDVQPDTWNKYNDFTNKSDDYHQNAGVGNKACYLLGYDPAGTNNTFGGITVTSKGRIATGKTYYYAIDGQYFGESYESYDTYRTALESAAQYYDSLYPGSGMYLQTINAMDAIGIWKSDGALPLARTNYRSTAVKHVKDTECPMIYLFFTKDYPRSVFYIYYNKISSRTCGTAGWYGPFDTGTYAVDGPYAVEELSDQGVIYYHRYETGNDPINYMTLNNGSCCTQNGSIPNSPQIKYGPAVSKLDGVHWIFYVDKTTNILKYRDRVGQYQHSLGVTTYYSPATVAVNSRIFLIYVGTDNRIYYKNNNSNGLINNTNWVSGVLSTSFSDDFEPLTDMAPSVGGPWMTSGTSRGIYVMWKHMPLETGRRRGLNLLTFNFTPSGGIINMSRGVLQNEGTFDADATATGSFLPFESQIYMFYSSYALTGQIIGKFKSGR